MGIWGVSDTMKETATQADLGLRTGGLCFGRQGLPSRLRFAETQAIRRGQALRVPFHE
jgi:hypothetical protein